MDSLIIFILLVISSIHFGNCADEEYRLPSHYSIEQYDILLTVKKDVFDGTSLEFTGSVKIDFKLLETIGASSISSIQLHAPFTKFDKVSVYAHSSSTTELVENYTLDNDTSILTINLNVVLSTVGKYVIDIAYTGQLETTGMHGFYRSSYTDTDKKTKYLLATKFEPVHARKAFPCFDEPEFKAKYIFSITYPQEYTAFFNTPQTGVPTKVDDEYETASFVTTPEMSTYLVAFSVSDFDCTQNESADKKLVYGVCSRKDTEPYRQLASEYGPKILDALGKLTDIFFSEHDIGKMDQLAIPDFHAGAMENYGLVTYRETALLYDDDESSNRFKQSIITIIAHEFSHMWFGDWVTLNWWDNTFLNEGFARYFQYFTIVEIDELNSKENWDMARQFVIETQQGAFLADSSNTSLSLTSPAATLSDISGKFGTISYSKGASIIRMLTNIIEENNLLKGIQYYLQTFAHKNTQPSDLWTTIETATSVKEYLPDNVPLAEVMDNWINKPGYPIVQVFANNSNVIVTQKRFLYEGENDTQWYVPITYTVSNNLDKFLIVSPDNWLIPHTDLVLKEVLKDSDWIILNNRESAYYRVNYDSVLWDKIRTALFNDPSKIDVLNRAQIVDDLFNLAQADEVNYSDTFNIIKYLENETDYYPWYSAINGFNNLLRLFARDSKVIDALKTLQLNLMKEVTSFVPFNKDNNTDQIYTLKKVLILQQACSLGEKKCLSTAKDLFNSVKNGTRINKNLKSIVYCNGLRHSSNITGDWTHLWNKFQTSLLATEQLTILTALGCTKDKSYLKKYLQESIKVTSGIRVQDLSTVWGSVVKSNSEGVDVALDFFIKNYKDILKYYPGGTSFISIITSSFTNEVQVQKLQTFASGKDIDDSVKKAAETGIKIANANIKWASTRKADFNDYFGISRASSKGITSIFIFILAIVLVLN